MPNSKSAGIYILHNFIFIILIFNFSTSNCIIQSFYTNFSINNNFFSLFGGVIILFSTISRPWFNVLLIRSWLSGIIFTIICFFSIRRLWIYVLFIKIWFSGITFAIICFFSIRRLWIYVLLNRSWLSGIIFTIICFFSIRRLWIYVLFIKI